MFGYFGPPEADEPPVVPPMHACPSCGERNIDELIWLDDDRVECQRCRAVCQPREEKGGGDGGA